MASAGRILILPKGNYNASTTYDMLDLVNHNGKSWLAKKTSKGIEPSDANSEYWQNMFDINAENFGALSKHGGILDGNVTIQKDTAEIVLKKSDTSGTIIQKNSSDNGDYGSLLVDISGDVMTVLTLRNGQLLMHKHVNGVEIGNTVIAEIKG